MPNQTFVDQIEADEVAEKFLIAVAVAVGERLDKMGLRIEWQGLARGEGRIGLLWWQNQLMATTTVVRDEFNRSIVACSDFSEIERLTTDKYQLKAVLTWILGVLGDQGVRHGQIFAIARQGICNPERTQLLASAPKWVRERMPKAFENANV